MLLVCLGHSGIDLPVRANPPEPTSSLGSSTPGGDVLWHGIGIKETETPCQLHCVARTFSLRPFEVQASAQVSREGLAGSLRNPTSLRIASSWGKSSDVFFLSFPCWSFLRDLLILFQYPTWVGSKKSHIQTFSGIG